MMEEALKVRSLEEQAEVDGFREPAQYIPPYQANMPGVTHINAEAQVETGEGGEEREVRPPPAARLQSAFVLICKAAQPQLHAALVMNPIMDGGACCATHQCSIHAGSSWHHPRHARRTCIYLCNTMPLCCQGLVSVHAQQIACTCLPCRSGWIALGCGRWAP